ncbi:MAM and LDL-receptor class A domain-containing protein 1-like [Mercenaria mercenaria]|uniref:MAM and LDL-receptor class A domain-containing protein 1-like n=1 Tax=Mercenaria mercenaria TaxID=6596 RepID=UPI00234E6E91|nr:MAM and LDL-receptor class A domain-containing protein 1-like [Mercenaria mercenaria]
MNIDPAVEELLRSNEFSVLKSSVLASRNAVDIATSIVQTMNRHAKSESGMIGFSRNYAAYFCLCLTCHYRARYIAFEGVRGDGFKGDIAVDDISIIPTLCTLDLVSLDCNFEDGLCNWQQENSDDFDWLRESGDTPSSDTGPSSDHTTGDDGHYIYIKATDQDKEDKAVISSPVQNSGPFCLTFWYNMYGTDIGALNVYMILNGGNKSLLFAKSKNHGHSVWRKAVISNNATDTYRIAFEGVRGDDFKGDIAVDDISIIPTLCFLARHRNDFTNLFIPSATPLWNYLESNVTVTHLSSVNSLNQN